MQLGWTQRQQQAQQTWEVAHDAQNIHSQSKPHDCCSMWNKAALHKHTALTHAGSDSLNKRRSAASSHSSSVAVCVEAVVQFKSRVLG